MTDLKVIMLSPWNFAQLRFQPAMSSSPDLYVFTMIQTVGSTSPRLDFSHETESILLDMQPAARISCLFRI
jgi:hypothetical protein